MSIAFDHPFAPKTEKLPYHRRNASFIGRPPNPECSEKDRKKWHGMPPTKVEREKLSFRATDIKF